MSTPTQQVYTRPTRTTRPTLKRQQQEVEIEQASKRRRTSSPRVNGQSTASTSISTSTSSRVVDTSLTTPLPTIAINGRSLSESPTTSSITSSSSSSTPDEASLHAAPATLPSPSTSSTTINTTTTTTTTKRPLSPPTYRLPCPHSCQYHLPLSPSFPSTQGFTMHTTFHARLPRNTVYLEHNPNGQLRWDLAEALHRLRWSHGLALTGRGEGRCVLRAREDVVRDLERRVEEEHALRGAIVPTTEEFERRVKMPPPIVERGIDDDTDAGRDSARTYVEGLVHDNLRRTAVHYDSALGLAICEAESERATQRNAERRGTDVDAAISSKARREIRELEKKGLKILRTMNEKGQVARAAGKREVEADLLAMGITGVEVGGVDRRGDTGVFVRALFGK